MQKIRRLQTALSPHRLVVAQMVLMLLCTVIIFTSQASAVIRFNDRSLFMYDPTPSITTKYVVSFTYNNQGVSDPTVGSIDLLFCLDPIPSEPITSDNPVDHHPCVAPVGLDVAHAVLSGQTGETGFSILSQTTNHIVLTRTATLANETPSSYTFDNVINPVDTTHSFAIRMSDYAAADASGPLTNLGSILSQSSEGVTLETQVPPILVFCVNTQVTPGCLSTSGTNYTDMGNLDPQQTLTGVSQIGAGTNASSGYVITVNGTTMQAGTHVIDPLATPTVSAPGNSQFGINLVANSSPNIGSDPDGPFSNAVAAPGYDTPNHFKFHDGDLVASAPNVSLIRRFTVSYIVNVPPNLRAGVYTTTITYICSGRF